MLPIPLAEQQVTLFANLPGLQRINLSYSALKDILAAKITRWNDERIAHDNPRLQLPHCSISLVTQSEDTLAVYLLNRYLKRDSIREAGPNAIREPNNHHLRKVIDHTEAIKRVLDTPGALGYGCESTIPSGLACVAVEMGSGNYELPASYQRTSDMPTVPGTIHSTDTARTGILASYPISGLLWAIMPHVVEEEEKAQALTDMLAWMILDAQASLCKASPLLLPDVLQTAALTSLERVTVQGRQMFHLARLDAVIRKRRPNTQKQFRPRKRKAQLRLMASSVSVPNIQAWLSAYAELAPKVEITLLHCRPSIDWTELFDEEIDAIFWHEKPREEDMRRTRHKDQPAICLECGGVCEAKERWLVCGKGS